MQKKAMLLITLTTISLFIGMMIKRDNASSQLSSYNQRYELLQEDLDNEQENTKEIEKMSDYMKTDEYIEEAAREKLGLIKDNETVFRKK